MRETYDEQQGERGLGGIRSDFAGGHVPKRAAF
jgi:hypothetical protein